MDDSAGESTPAGLGDRMSTGIAGLDAILGGGLPRKRLYLVQGDPGTGKTTLAMQFLIEGVRCGERGLYVTLSETRDELLEVARSHGWSLDGIELYEVTASEEHLKPEEEYTAFHPAEVELGETVQALLEEVERVKPQRAVIDSLSEMRLLARDPLRYRRQILALKQFFLARGCTIVFLDDPINRTGEHPFQTLAHGAIAIERMAPEYGKARRRLQIAKLRGVNFHDGYHDCTIKTGGLVVYPRLMAAKATQSTTARVSSGLVELDKLLGGGPERGTSALVLGAAGAGKTTLCVQYAMAAAARGERSAFFSFDERLETLFNRSAGIGFDLRDAVKQGRIIAEQVDPAVLSPGEFIHRVRRAVEHEKAGIVVIDSLNGYLNAMPGERFLVIQMHELLTYLGDRGVLTLIVIAQHGLLGSGVQAPIDLSYLADTVLLLRYFEHLGRVRKSIAAVKTRGGGHEDLIRELQITSSGLRLGEPLADFQGILTGTPTFYGAAPLLYEKNQQGRGGPAKGG